MKILAYSVSIFFCKGLTEAFSSNQLLSPMSPIFSRFSSTSLTIYGEKKYGDDDYSGNEFEGNFNGENKTSDFFEVNGINGVNGASGFSEGKVKVNGSNGSDEMFEDKVNGVNGLGGATFVSTVIDGFPSVIGTSGSFQGKVNGVNFEHFEDDSYVEIAEQDVRDLFQLWESALASREPRIVAQRYSKDALLLPTESDYPCTSNEMIIDYYDLFLKKIPRAKILDSKIRIGKGWAQDAGIYEITMASDYTKLKARYTFVYVYERGQWRISLHHSSVMPEDTVVPKEISETEVRNLFNRWNHALLSLNPDTIASRYSKNAVLLPIASDIPRTTPELIKDYYVHFVQSNPQCMILESHVTTGVNWAKDVGIYEFTMGVDNTKVNARYSLVYLFEENDWKIVHHHTSIMPECTTVTKKCTEEQIKNLFFLWNNALATGDSSLVTNLYAKKSVLLPMTSGIPCTSNEQIKGYYDTFLKKKPRGRIIESNVYLGINFAQNVGVYEFRLGEDEKTLKARYTFNYVFEDGAWKISHHHSSVMPEASVNLKMKGETKLKSVKSSPERLRKRDMIYDRLCKILQTFKKIK